MAGMMIVAFVTITLAPHPALAASLEDSSSAVEASTEATDSTVSDDGALSAEDVAAGVWVSYADAPPQYADAISAASNAPLSSDDDAVLSAFDSAASNTDAADADAADVADAALRPPPEPSGGCPGGTSYNGANQKWSCMEVQKDDAGRGHAVWVRIGNKGGFGYLHALLDHNLDLDPIIATISSNGHGIKQKNGRYLYGEVFISKNKPKQYVEVYEQRTKGTGSPDNYEMGVVTAFCRNASYAEENQCPEWVNQSL